MRRYETSEVCTVCGCSYGFHHWDDDACPAGPKENDGWAKTVFSPKSKSYTVVEKFADNGEHSHFDLINAAGETVWSESGQPSPQEESFLKQNEIWLEVIQMLQPDPNFIDGFLAELHKDFTITRKQPTNQ